MTLAYIVLPRTHGAKLIYERVVDPFLADHEQRVDAMLELASRQASIRLLELKRAGLELLAAKGQDAQVALMKLLTQLAQAQQQAATAAAATETEIDSATPKHASDKVSIQADPRVTTADCGAGEDETSFTAHAKAE